MRTACTAYPRVTRRWGGKALISAGGGITESTGQLSARTVCAHRVHRVPSIPSTPPLGLLQESWASIDINRHFFSSVCTEAMFMQITLFLFNLCIPCYPLDGGRALVAVLLLKGVFARLPLLPALSLPVS